MTKTTIVIPVRDELYLNQTVDDIFSKATGDIEVIVVLDDCWNLPLPKDRPKLTIIHNGKRSGIRGAINAGAELGKGDFLMKIDAHCIFQEGFDELLTSTCDQDWLMTMRRYTIDPDTWTKKQKRAVRHEYLQYPYREDGKLIGIAAKYWWYERDSARESFVVDENMTFQGSSWMMPMKYFRDLIYPMDIENYGMFIGEPEEIGLKVWLSGGKVMINKDVWYAHLFKGKWYRSIYLEKTGTEYKRTSDDDIRKGIAYSNDFWLHDKWNDKRRIHDFSWLIDKFWPVPGWPENWRELI